jgi:hypothetical protein
MATIVPHAASRRDSKQSASPASVTRTDTYIGLRTTRYSPLRTTGRIYGRERALPAMTEVPNAPDQARDSDDQERQTNPSDCSRLLRDAVARQPQRDPDQHRSRKHEREERGPKPQHCRHSGCSSVDASQDARSAYSGWSAMNSATYQHSALARRLLARTSSSAYCTSCAPSPWPRRERSISV